MDSQVARLQEQQELAWTAQAKQVDNLSAKERLMEDFGRQFQVVDRNIAKLFDSHQELATKVDSEFSAVRDDFSKAPTENLISEFISSQLSEYNISVDRGLQDIVMNMQNLSRLVSTKADKDEVLQTIADRIKRLRSQLESKGNDEDLAAGLVTCLTCGSGKQREISPPKSASFNDSLDSSSFDRISYTLGEDTLSREDYEVVAGILRGDSTLKPLGKQYAPMRPKPNPYLRRAKELEPLYRRAKHANQVREMVKITSPERTIASASSVVYHFEDSSSGYIGERAFSEQGSHRRGKGGITASKPLSREFRGSFASDLELSSESKDPESPVRLPKNKPNVGGTASLVELTGGSLPSFPLTPGMKGHLHKGSTMTTSRPTTSHT